VPVQDHLRPIMHLRYHLGGGVRFDEFGARDAAQVHLKKHILGAGQGSAPVCAMWLIHCLFFLVRVHIYSTYGRASAASYAKRSRSRRTSPLVCSKWKCGLRNQTETKTMSCAPVNRRKGDLVG
jgi:hypothetical protein